MFALLVTGSTLSTFARRIQCFVNKLITSGVSQIEGLPFELPAQRQIDFMVKVFALKYEKKITRVVNGGILIQRKESLSNYSKLEGAMKVFIYFDDWSFTTLFVYSDGTAQELPTPDRIGELRPLAGRGNLISPQ